MGPQLVDRDRHGWRRLADRSDHRSGVDTVERIGHAATMACAAGVVGVIAGRVVMAVFGHVVVCHALRASA